MQLKRGASEIREVFQPISRALNLLQREDTLVSESTRARKELLTSSTAAYKEFVGSLRTQLGVKRAGKLSFFYRHFNK